MPRSEEEIEDSKKEAIKGIISGIRHKLTLDGRSRVFTSHRPLASLFLIEPQDPEDFTRDFLIDRVLFDVLSLDLEGRNRSFRGAREHTAHVDYALKNSKCRFLLEAKPINTNLFDERAEGAVNQARGLFRIVEVKDNYEFSVATNGFEWVFIDRDQNIVNEGNKPYKLVEDFDKIKLALLGEERVVSQKLEEEISKKFYDWYNALLYGGRYKNHKNSVENIDPSDSLIENISNCREEDKQHVAQLLIDRLIFIKFAYSKKIIETDILLYISGLDEDLLNVKLKLAFESFNTHEDERDIHDRKLKDLPYIDGNLFELREVERENPQYRINSGVLKRILRFLDGFRFIHARSSEAEDMLDPEILGYIFERAMNARDRKGTGAYYTRKQITEHIAENTIKPYILKKANDFLLNEKVYRESELLKDFDHLFTERVHTTTLVEIRDKIIREIRVLDNACGSGAFLLAVAKTLLDIEHKIEKRLGVYVADTELKRSILLNNIYGVDLNADAVEIAKLRLWLWLMGDYRREDVKPLPNIDYNLRVGNSLIGFYDVDRFRETQVTLSDYSDADNVPFFELMNNWCRLKSEYRGLEGHVAGEKKRGIQDIERRAKKLLNGRLFKELAVEKKIKISEEELWDANPFHWGFEFNEIFDSSLPEEEWGFDIIVGNPPWEIWKPNSQEFFTNYDEDFRKLNNQQALKRIEELCQDEEIKEAWEHYCRYIEYTAQIFTKWDRFKHQSGIVNGRRVSGDLNLYKLFLESTYNLLKKDGFCGYVIPSGLYSDAGCKGLRELFFDNNEIEELYAFENRKAIFGDLHRSFKFILFIFKKGGKTDKFKSAFFIGKNYATTANVLEEIDEHSLDYSIDSVKKLSPSSLSIVELKDETDIKICEKLLKHPHLFERIQDTWNVKLTRGFDMTKYSHLFLPSGNGLPMLEGKNIHQYTGEWKNAPTARYEINEKGGRKELLNAAKKKVVETVDDEDIILYYQTYYFGFRRIARSTDERTLISAILPKGKFASESICFIDPITQQNVEGVIFSLSPSELCFICGVFNSFVVDYLIRMKVSANLNMFYIYELPVPRYTDGDLYFNEIIEGCAKLVCTTSEYDDLKREIGIDTGVADEEERQKLKNQIDAYVAKIYGLSEDELSYILKKFPLVDGKIKEGVIEEFQKLSDD